MEAMGSAVPVIASNISGIPELVQDQETGLLVPPRDAASLANALERYANDPDLRRRLGHAGRARVIGDFDLDQNATRLAQHFLKDHE
jgi:glycosyltransferase involved in cell wall biosynthesis